MEEAEKTAEQSSPHPLREIVQPFVDAAKAPRPLRKNLKKLEAGKAREAVSRGTQCLTFEMDVDVIPMGELLGDLAQCFIIGISKACHRCIREYDAEAPGDVSGILFVDSNLSVRARLLH